MTKVTRYVGASSLRRCISIVVHRLAIIPLGAVLCLGGCAALDGLFDTGQQSHRAPGRISRDGDGSAHRPAEGIEVTWQVPSEPVDGFVVRYGYDRSHLDTESKVSVSLLKPEKDPEFGPVYRFIVPGVKSNAVVFVSVAAFKGERISDFSAVIQESGSRSAPAS